MKQYRITLSEAVPPGLEAPEPLPVPRLLATTTSAKPGTWTSTIGDFAYIGGEFYKIMDKVALKKPRIVKPTNSIPDTEAADE